MTSLPPEDQPGPPAQRWVEDGEIEQTFQPGDLTDPFTVGMTFLAGLDDPQEYQFALRQLVTPESLESWGDFRAVSEAYKSIQNPGFGSVVNRAEGADDVGYLKILRGVEESYQMLEDRPILAAASLTLVWRPERGQWMVHAYGRPVQPEDVPRTASHGS